MMQFRKSVWFTFQVEMLHCWPDASGDVEYLKYPHRHLFHFKVWASVSHGDREIEFIGAKANIGRLVLERYERLMKTGIEAPRMSCEDWAEYVVSLSPQFVACEVSEDGENGALVERPVERSPVKNVVRP